MSKNAVCFHHMDTDGHCGGAIIRHFVQKRGLLSEEEITDVKCIGLQYGYDPKDVFDNINEDSIVFITDFSLTPKDMQEVNDLVEKVVWIDHHESAIRKLEEFSSLDGLRDTEYSAALLTWLWCSKQIEEPAIEGAESSENEIIIPPAIKMISDYDTWNHDPMGQAVTFEMGMSILDTRPDSKDAMDMWEAMFTINEVVDPSNEDNIKERFRWDAIMQTMNLGGVCLTYKNNRSSSWLKHAFIRDLDIAGKTYKCYVFNGRLEDSYCFDFAPKTEETIDANVWYWYDGKKYIYSIRSAREGVNVSEIAEFFGGGGHPDSSAFTFSKDIFHTEPTENNTSNNKKEE